jgi:hypothetical protein
LRFTVRRPPNGEVSPCGHRPSGGDVACGVDVGVASSSSACLALEDRLALAVLRSDVAARGASLRRIRCRNLLDPSVSLVLQPCGEKPPTAAADCPVKPTLLSYTHAWMLDSAAGRPCHRPHVECFDSDRVEPRHTCTLTTTADIPGLARQPDTADWLFPRTEVRNFQPKGIQ